MKNAIIGPDRENCAKSACVHHWVIEPPIGLVSPGVCRLCGEGREFKNYITATDWSKPDLSAGIGSTASGSFDSNEWRIPEMVEKDVLVS
ncbi:MAG: hypothetical protein O3A93_12120 [Chloroflexi bacterium]|nr:hypothetical protein [Chloroflexota bacterium]PKB58138.1 MAG: hypothetical protein BZY83_08785 [SAR202 cluster bacterium Casp-Chloro-G2]